MRSFGIGGAIRQIIEDGVFDEVGGFFEKKIKKSVLGRRRNFPGAKQENDAGPENDRQIAAEGFHLKIIPFLDLNSSQKSGMPPTSIRATPAAEMTNTGEVRRFGLVGGVGEGLTSDSSVAVRSMISRFISGWGFSSVSART